MSTPVQILTVRVPFAIRKGGGRKLAIAADGSTLAPPRRRIDSTLVKALARGSSLEQASGERPLRLRRRTRRR